MSLVIGGHGSAPVRAEVDPCPEPAGVLSYVQPLRLEPHAESPGRRRTNAA